MATGITAPNCIAVDMEGFPYVISFNGGVYEIEMGVEGKPEPHLR